MRKNFYLLLKVTLLLVIFVWIICSVNIKEAIKVLLKANIYLVIIAFLLNNLSNLFLTAKWYRLATPLKIKSSFFDLLALNYISMFYSIFVPGQSSGELIKGLKLASKEGGVQKVWVPIFIDKITNLLIIFVIGFIAILYDDVLRKNTLIFFTVASLTLLLGLITIILFSNKTGKIVKIFKDIFVNILKKFLKLDPNIVKNFSVNYFEDYKNHKLLMIETILWSFLIKLPHILVYYYLASSLNINLSLIQSAWLFAIVSVATLIPISFSGLGVREGTVVVLLSQIGIQSYTALSLSMLIFTIGLVSGLIGGVFEMFTNFHITSNKIHKH